MKKLKVFALLLFSLFLFSGCNLIDPENPEIPEGLIDTPTGVSITDGVVSWNAVTDATEYRVIVGTTSYTTTETSYDLKTISGLAVGDHQVSIIAVGDNKVSLPSQTLTYTIQIVSGLGAPVNLVMNDQDVLSWNAVEEATYYIVSVGQMKYQKETTTMDLSEVTIPRGSYQITVTAYNETESSLPSTALELTLTEDRLSLNYATMLSKISEDYEPGMTLDDFEDLSFEYMLYQEAEYRSKNMLLGAFRAGVSEEQLMEVIDYMDENEFDGSPIAMMAMIKDMKDFDLSTTQLSELIYNLALGETYVESFSLLSEVDMYEEDLENFEDYLNELLLIPNYIYWNNMFQTYLTAEEYQVIQSYLDGNTEFYSPNANLNTIFYDDVLYLYDIYSDDNPYDEEDEQEVHRLLYKVVIGMNEDDIDISESYEEGYMSLYVFNNIRNVNLNMIDVRQSILEYQDSYNDLLSDHQAYIDQKTVHIEAIKTVLDYIWLLEETIPNTWLASIGDALNDESFTLEELAILKDEIIDVLIASIPNEEDFQSINKALYQIILTQTDELNSDETSVVAELASAQHQAIEMLLTFIGWIDVDQMMMLQENVPQIVGSLQSMESFDDLLSQLDNMIEIMDLWDAFVLENAEVVTEMDDESMTVLIEFVYEINIRFQISNYDPNIPWQLEEIKRAEYLLENLDLISNSSLLMNEKYKNLYDYLFGNERANYEDIIDLVEKVRADEDIDYISLNALKNHIHELLLDLEIDSEFLSAYFELYLATASYDYIDFTETNLQETAQYLGDFVYEFYLVALDMMDYLTVEDIVEIMKAQNRVYNIEEVTEVHTEYRYVCDDNGCSYRYVDQEYTRMETTIDKDAYKAFMLLLTQTLNEFIETYPTHVDSIEALLLDDRAANLYEFIMINEFDEEENNDEIKAIINRDKGNHMLLVANVFMASIDMLSELASSDGEIIDYLIFTMGDSVNDNEESFDPQLFIESILPYIDITLGYINEETSESIIKMFTFVSLMRSHFEDQDELVKFIEMFDSWVEDGALILQDTAALADAFNTYLIEHADYSMFDTYPSVDDQMAIFMIKNLHMFLTSTEIAEIKSIANQVVDNILSLPETMEILGLDQADIDEIQVDIMDFIDFYNEVFSDLSGRSSSETFEDFYYIDYILNHLFDSDLYEVFNPYLIDSVELDEEFVIDYSEGDHVIIPFEPLVDGYYGIVRPGQNGSVVSVYLADKTEVMLENTNLSPVNLKANQLYYFVYYNYASEGQITLSIEEVDMTGYFEDDPSVLSEDGLYPFNARDDFNYAYYSFEATEDSTYILTFEEYFMSEYPDVHITEITSIGKSSIWGYVQHDDLYFMELEVKSGANYIIQISTYGYAFQSYISWNEEFSNSELDPVALVIDVPLDLNDYQPFYTIWLSFDLESENTYTLQSFGEGYFSFTVYDAELNYYNDYWYMDSSGNYDVTLPQKGFLEINMSDYYGINEIILTKSEDYIDVVQVDSGAELHYDITGEDPYFMKYFHFVAPADGKYMIVLNTNGWGNLEGSYAYVNDLYFSFGDDYNDLTSVILEEGEKLTLLITIDNATYLDLMIDDIDHKGINISSAVVLTQNVSNVYYLEGDNTREYYKFTPTETRNYLLVIQDLMGYVEVYQTNQDETNSSYIGMSYNVEGDYYLTVLSLEANVTYYFLVESNNSEAGYLFGITNRMPQQTN